MATVVARLEAILAANTRDFDRAMSKSDSRLRKVGKTAGIATAAVGTVLVAGLAKSVKEAIEAEKSQARLEKAFAKNVKGGIKPYRGEIEKASKAAIQLGFDDEELADSIGSLVAATGNYQDAQRASNVAMDLARFKGISLEAATKTLTMTMSGSTRAARQLGIIVPTVTTTFDELKERFKGSTSEGGKLITATEELALENAKLIDKQKTAGSVIDIVSGKVKGQAKAYADTTEGGIKVFQLQMEEMQEQIGIAILPALNKIVEGLTKILQFFEKHPKLGQAVLIGLAGALALATAAQIALNLAVLANPYVAAAVGVAALAAGVYLLWTRVEQLRPVLLFIAGTLLGLPLPLRILVALFGEKLPEAIGKVTSAFKTLWSWIKKVIDGVKWLLDKIPDIPDLPGGGILGRGGGGPSSSNTGLIPMVTNAVGIARDLGWRGVVTSGFRTYQEQSALYQRYLAGGPLAARPGTSSHEKGQAVDVTDYGTFGRIMRGLPRGLGLQNKLGSRDPVHFSVTGYDRGGFLPTGLSLAYNGTGRPEPVGHGLAGDINLYIDGHKLFTWIRNEKQRRSNRGEAF